MHVLPFRRRQRNTVRVPRPKKDSGTWRLWLRKPTTSKRAIAIISDTQAGRCLDSYLALQRYQRREGMSWISDDPKSSLKCCPPIYLTATDAGNWLTLTRVARVLPSWQTAWLSCDWRRTTSLWNMDHQSITPQCMNHTPLLPHQCLELV